MQVIVHQCAFGGDFEHLSRLPRQALLSDWYGDVVTPTMEFSFATDGKNLWYLATRAKEATPHPHGESGAFTPELWKYDVAEWFVSTPDGRKYWEFNLSPAGAWWACAFDGVREADESVVAPKGVETCVREAETGWCVMAKIPLDELVGVDVKNCRLATTYILETPAQIFLTTADDLSGEPDFHRPQTFSTPLIK